MKFQYYFLFCGLGFASTVFSTPYPDPLKVILPSLSPASHFSTLYPSDLLPTTGLPVLRVQIDWVEGEKYSLAQMVKENSGTQALYAAKKYRDPLGSYQAELHTAQGIYYDSIGTGREFRKLARSLSFRFPHPEAPAHFILYAEHPDTGQMEKVLEQDLNPQKAKVLPAQVFTQRVLREPSLAPALELVIYAEGYVKGKEEKFFADAKKIAQSFEAVSFPGQGRFRISALFAPSASALGLPRDLGPLPVKKDSFLGLDHPYWDKFGRWDDVVYATDQNHFRSAVGQVAYDYPLALVDSNDYWGVGNYRELTAIPADNYNFHYLLLHEFGHFLGLNEEYEESGRTELEFAAGIDEPWSQNITFHPQRGELKWISLVTPGLSLPTSHFEGRNSDIGAYKGGYAGSAPAHSHKPAKMCMMGSAPQFCAVCKQAIAEQLKKDAGE